MKRPDAYTMGNKVAYDRAFEENPVVEKLGRSSDYSGGCCWPTFEAAVAYVDEHRSKLPYDPCIYGLILQHDWEQDTSNDTLEEEGFYSLLRDAIVVKIDENGFILS